MNFSKLKYTAIDFESTGFREDGTDEPIQLGMASMYGLEIRKESFYRSFISPNKERLIEKSTNRIHRITDLDLKNAPKLNELWPTINKALSGKVVVAHGAGTEKRFLRAFPMHGFKPWIDTLQLARKIIPKAKDHSLGALIDEIDYPTVNSLVPLGQRVNLIALDKLFEIGEDTSLKDLIVLGRDESKID